MLGNYKRAPGHFVEGDGVYLIDSTGKRYLDFVSGIAVNALGYGDPGLRAAMHSAADGLIHVSNLYATEPGEQLAAALVKKSFASKVFLCNSGAEANEGAFKFARRWARGRGDAKHEIIALRGAFHGRLFATLAATDRPSYRIPFRPLAPGIGIVERDIEDLAIALNPETVAALILEPVQGEGGVRVLDAGFVREVRALTAERDIALIFDEIQCGLGRTGTLFAYEHYGIEPDMLTLAKPIAGGLPMGAVLMTEDDCRDDQAGRPRHDVRRRSVRVVDRELHGRASVRSAHAASRHREWRVVRQAAQRARAAHRTDPRGAWYRIHVGNRRDGNSGTRGQRGVQQRAAHLFRRRVHRALLPPLVATRDELALGLGMLEEVL